MKLIVCIDDNNGLVFNNRRQSMDVLLRRDIYEMTGESSLWMNYYSYTQFEQDGKCNIKVDDNFLDKAGEDDYCFIENNGITEYVPEVTQIIIYKWNRTYPYDTVLDFLPWDNGWSLAKQKEFMGNSHDKITKEAYER